MAEVKSDPLTHLILSVWLSNNTKSKRYQKREGKTTTLQVSFKVPNDSESRLTACLVEVGCSQVKRIKPRKPVLSWIVS